MDAPKPIDRSRRDDLTIDEIKACPAFAHFSDEEAREVIEMMKAFTKIAYDFHQKRTENTKT